MQSPLHRVLVGVSFAPPPPEPEAKPKPENGTPAPPQAEAKPPEPAPAEAPAAASTAVPASHADAQLGQALARLEPAEAAAVDLAHDHPGLVEADDPDRGLVGCEELAGRRHGLRVWTEMISDGVLTLVARMSPLRSMMRPRLAGSSSVRASSFAMASASTWSI